MKALIYSLLFLWSASILPAQIDTYYFPLTVEEAAATDELSLGDAEPLGSAVVVLDREASTVYWNIRYTGLTGELQALHFHGPAPTGQPAGVVLPLVPGPSPIVGTSEVDSEFIERLDNGLIYLNLHTSANSAGEIRGQVLVNESPLVPFVFPMTVDQVPDSGSLNLGDSMPSGAAFAALNLETLDLVYRIEAEGLTTGGDPTAMHFHGPTMPGEPADVALGIPELELPSIGLLELTETKAMEMLTGQWYLNVHTEANPGGEIHGHAVPALGSVETFTFPLTAHQSTMNPELGDATPSGTGSALYDPETRTLVYSIAFDGLTGDAGALHFHGPADFGEPASVVVPIDDITSPSVGSEVLSEEHAGYFEDRRLYVNVHTSANAGGEIRGQVAPYNGVERLLPLYGALTPEAETGSVELNGAEPFGAVVAALDPRLNTLYYALQFEGLTGDVTGMHFHGPASAEGAADIRIGLNHTSSPQSGMVLLTSEMKQEVLDGLWYLNVHTAANPAGEIRAQVDRPGTAVIPYWFPLTPDQSEGEPVLGDATPTGNVAAALNFISREFAYAIEASGFTSDVIAMHFHGPAGVGVGAGVEVGIDDIEFPSVGGTVLTEEQMNQLLKGQWYLNIHTNNNGGGEIRGQVIGAPSGVVATNLLPASDQHEGDLSLSGATPSGTGMVWIDTAESRLLYHLDWQGLTGDAVAAHFHGPAAPDETAGVRIPIDDVMPPTTGWTMLEAAQLTDFVEGRIYVNVHTDANPGGEIRAHVVPPQQLFFGEADETANGWWESDWFGPFFGQPFPWIFQDGLGWIYCLNSGFQDLFLYDLKIGTFYTRAGFYPHLYSYSEGAWLYYFGSQGTRRYYWHYGTSDVLIVE